MVEHFPKILASEEKATTIGSSHVIVQKICDKQSFFEGSKQVTSVLVIPTQSFHMAFQPVIKLIHLSSKEFRGSEDTRRTNTEDLNPHSDPDNSIQAFSVISALCTTGENTGVNELERQKLGGQNSWQRVKFVKLSSDLLQVGGLGKPLLRLWVPTRR